MKKKNLIICIAIIALFWFTKDMAAMHYDNAAAGLSDMHARATQS